MFKIVHAPVNDDDDNEDNHYILIFFTFGQGSHKCMSRIRFQKYLKFFFRYR